MTEQQQRPTAGRRVVGVTSAVVGVMGACIAVYGLAVHDSSVQAYGGLLTLVCVIEATIILSPPRD